MAAKKKKPVKLLTGGNPQIAKADGDAAVQEYIDAMPGWKRALGKRLDALVDKALGDAKKAVRWNTAFYGREGQGWFLAFNCTTRYVKVAFFRGAHFTPLPPGESKQEHVRYLDIREEQTELDEKQFITWVKQASKQPGATMFK
jgi:hypothetical protein